MKKLILISVLLFCICNLARAQELPVQAALTLAQTRFTKAATIEATLELTALQSLPAPLLVVDDNGNVLSDEITLSKGETQNITLKLEITEQALQNGNARIKLKVPQKVKREIQYSNLPLTQEIHLVALTELNTLELVYKDLPSVVLTNNNATFNIQLQNFGEYDASDITLHFLDQAINIPDIKAGENYTTELQIKNIQSDIQLTPSLTFTMNNEKVSKEFASKIIHTGIAYIKIKEKK